jgi:hypothetical protein
VAERFDPNGKAWAQLPDEFDPDYVAPEKPDKFDGPHRGMPKVLRDAPGHDEKVRELIALAMEQIERKEMLRGVGVMEFDDATVVVISQVIPHREVFVTRCAGQNSILHGGFSLY